MVLSLLSFVAPVLCVIYIAYLYVLRLKSRQENELSRYRYEKTVKENTIAHKDEFIEQLQTELTQRSANEEDLKEKLADVSQRSTALLSRNPQLESFGKKILQDCVSRKNPREYIEKSLGLPLLISNDNENNPLAYALFQVKHEPLHIRLSLHIFIGGEVVCRTSIEKDCLTVLSKDYEKITIFEVASIAILAYFLLPENNISLSLITVDNNDVEAVSHAMANPALFKIGFGYNPEKNMIDSEKEITVLQNALAFLENQKIVSEESMQTLRVFFKSFEEKANIEEELFEGVETLDDKVGVCIRLVNALIENQETK